MPGVTDVLQSLRTGGYPSGGPSTPTEAAPALERSLALTPEEVKSIPPASGGEICLSVYGVLEGDTLQVTRVEPEAAPEDNSEPTPEDVMGMPNRAMPSPS